MRSLLAFSAALAILTSVALLFVSYCVLLPTLGPSKLCRPSSYTAETFEIDGVAVTAMPMQQGEIAGGFVGRSEFICLDSFRGFSLVRDSIGGRICLLQRITIASPISSLSPRDNANGVSLKIQGHNWRQDELLAFFDKASSRSVVRVSTLGCATLLSTAWIVWSAVLYGVLQGGRYLRKWWRARGSCAECGYCVGTPHARCPECGSVRVQRVG